MQVSLLSHLQIIFVLLLTISHYFKQQVFYAGSKIKFIDSRPCQCECVPDLVPPSCTFNKCCGDYAGDKGSHALSPISLGGNTVMSTEKPSKPTTISKTLPQTYIKPSGVCIPDIMDSLCIDILIFLCSMLFSYASLI